MWNMENIESIKKIINKEKYGKYWKYEKDLDFLAPQTGFYIVFGLNFDRRVGNVLAMRWKCFSDALVICWWCHPGPLVDTTPPRKNMGHVRVNNWQRKRNGHIYTYIYIYGGNKKYINIWIDKYRNEKVYIYIY